jgi:hypothetical protein
MKSVGKRFETGKGYHFCNPCIEELEKQGLPAMNNVFPYVDLTETKPCERCGKIADRILNVILFKRLNQ